MFAVVLFLGGLWLLWHAVVGILLSRRDLGRM